MDLTDSRSRSEWRLAPIVVYFALAFAITWSLILVFVASRSFAFDSFSATDGLIIFAFMCLGPSTAGLLMTVWVGGRRGLRDLWSRMRVWRSAPPPTGRSRC